MDACFKLKLKDRGFDDTDLGTGLAYFVNEATYQKHLSTAADVHETVSLCRVATPCPADHFF